MPITARTTSGRAVTQNAVNGTIVQSRHTYRQIPPPRLLVQFRVQPVIERPATTGEDSGHHWDELRRDIQTHVLRRRSH